MASREYHLHDGKKGAALAIRITPRASKDEVSEILSDGTVKIHLAASTSDARLNHALVAFLAEILEIPAGNIDVIVGASGRDKLVSIIDLDADTVHQRILKHIA